LSASVGGLRIRFAQRDAAAPMSKVTVPPL